MSKILGAVAVVVLALLTVAAAGGGDVVSPAQSTDASFPQDVQLAGNLVLDVPFEPTPETVVEEMIRIARVGKEDVLYDLGCGDGRIVISAAKKTGCRGVGVDIDPERIRESRENAVRAGVSDRTRFIVQDLFEADIREATVVMIFLYPEVNIRLRPKILNDLSPGARLVSHMHNMGDWMPDRTSFVGYREILYWVIPANAGGTWEWTLPGKPKKAYRLELEQRYQRVRGVLSSEGRKITLSGAKLTGRQLMFTAEEKTKGRRIVHEFTGTVGGDAIVGTVTSKEGRKVQSEKWEALRDPSTRRPIDTDSDSNSGSDWDIP